MNALSSKTSLHELLQTYPFLEPFLVDYHPRFQALRNRLMRATVGRVATLGRVAAMGGLDLQTFLVDLRHEIQQQTGETLEVDCSGSPQPLDASMLQALIKQLHAGVPFEEVKAQFDELTADVEPGEIAAMEEQLIREGMPVEEVQRLCDLHVGVFADSLDAQAEVSAPPGHPVHTYMAENERIRELAGALDQQLKALDRELGEERLAALAPELEETLEELAKTNNHYVRKENALFPALETHDISGPTQVMWGVHDDIRSQLKAVRQALAAGFPEPLVRQGTALARAMIEMIYKENKILFPLAMEALEPSEWRAIRASDDELGYAYIEPVEWPGADETAETSAPASPANGKLKLRTGELSLEQVTQIFRHLPVELSFVDPDGYVRFYSDQPERHFPRAPNVIGRHVEKCHPPKSLHLVRQILEAFASGEREEATFWIEMNGRFLHIAYYAVHNDDGDYLGCLEVSQDATELRSLTGEKRLLDWESD